MTPDERHTAHMIRNELHSAAWYAARALPKEERKIERAMQDMAARFMMEFINSIGDNHA